MPLALLLAGCLLDRDGYEAARARLTDDDTDGYSEHDGDCDDSQAAIYPGAVDRCDDLDNDCDGLVDEDGGTTAWYPDRDADGFGDEAEVSTACVAPAGWVELGGDCDDAEALINPDADEVCGGGDEDCDGTTDERAIDAATWYLDEDGDGYVAGLDDSVSACDAPEGYAAVNGDLDCDDADATVYPGAPEVCGDGVVNACGATTECRYEGTNELSHAVIDNNDRGLLPAVLVAEFSGDDKLDVVFEHSSADGVTDEIGVLAGPFPTHVTTSLQTASWTFSELAPAWFVVGRATAGAHTSLVVDTRDEDTDVDYLRRLDNSGGEVEPEPVWLTTDAGQHIEGVAFGEHSGVTWVPVSSGDEETSRLVMVDNYEPDGATLSGLENYVSIPESLGFGIASCDLDGDAIEEVFVTDSADRLLRFDGADVRGAVSASTARGRLQTDGSGFGVCLGDISGDGLDDLAVASVGAGLFLLDSFPTDGELADATSTELLGPGLAIGLGVDNGDLDDDGLLDLAVGSVDADFADFGGSTRGTDGGCALVFYGPFTSGTRTVTDPNAAAFCSSTDYGFFGLQVAMSGDITGDGIDDLVSTAVLETASDGVSQGIVYVIPGLTP